jgi:hypothetical protein
MMGRYYRRTGVTRRRGGDECFADEAAIDFPAVRPLAARVRDEFLNEPDPIATLVAAVELSRRDARLGAIVPLRIPLRGTCPTCGGRGETWTDPCGPCQGTGSTLFSHAIRVSVPAGVADGARLRFRVRSPHAPPARVEVRVAIRCSAA